MFGGVEDGLETESIIGKSEVERMKVLEMCDLRERFVCLFGTLLAKILCVKLKDTKGIAGMVGELGNLNLVAIGVLYGQPYMANSYVIVEVD